MIVVDTNVLISGFIKPTSVPGGILWRILEGSVLLAISRHLLDELKMVLQRDHIRRLLLRNWSEKELEAVVEKLKHIAIVFPDHPPVANWIPEDPDDNWVVQCAITAQAQHIISGDKHLRGLGVVEGIIILNPRQFLEKLDSDGL